jgi:hypothetical protein
MSGSNGTASDSLTTALVAVVEAENAAVYGYSVAGARLSSSAQRLVARGDYDVHRAQVPSTTSWLSNHSDRTAGDGTVSAAPPAAVYALPSPVTDAASALALLAALEENTAARYADVVSLATGNLQRAAALALQSAAVREAKWRNSSVPFPGLTGRLPGSNS